MNATSDSPTINVKLLGLGLQAVKLIKNGTRNLRLVQISLMNILLMPLLVLRMNSGKSGLKVSSIGSIQAIPWGPIEVKDVAEDINGLSNSKSPDVFSVTNSFIERVQSVV